MLHRAVAGADGSGAAHAPALARVRFGRVPLQQPETDGALSIHVPLATLGDQPEVIDVVAASGPVRTERIGDVDVATDGQVLAGHVRLDERDTNGLRAAAHRAYMSIFAALDRSDCRAPLRFWNYVPRINAPLDGLERYRHFNVGRHEAFLAAGRAAFSGAPAACALGSPADTLVVYFVAAREPPAAIENPRQVSAYHYPPDYGPRSPTFSRATLHTAGSPVLFLSGTASIVGHRSEHAGDPVAQTRETFVNIRAVVGAANKRLGVHAFTADTLAYTVYVRRQADFAAIRAQFMQEVGDRSVAARDALFLEGDICRAELLVEIEATGHAR